MLLLACAHYNVAHVATFKADSDEMNKSQPIAVRHDYDSTPKYRKK